MIGPRRSLILARLEGGRLADTGVMQGMSGSPVFIDGRLIGAVSYSLGAFSKEPIAGITPIAEMTDATAMPAARPATARAASFSFSKWPPTNEDYVAALREAFSRLGPEGFRTGVGSGNGIWRHVARRRRPRRFRRLPRRRRAPPDRHAADHGGLFG